MGETRVILSRELISEPDSDSQDDIATMTKPLANKVERKEARRTTLAVLLDNIRSAWNVGSIFRSADGFGFSHVYLCGITPTPENEAVTKTSLGAEDSIPWSYHKDAVRFVQGLKAEGWKVYGLEEDARAVPLESNGLPLEWQAQVTPRRPGDAPALQILILGNEVTGVDPELLDLCDLVFYIPMRGEKKSFNVAIAFGVAAYALTNQKLVP
jgi:tRNA G18 (ribose-2'-O)-methylase SpoU